MCKKIFILPVFLIVALLFCCQLEAKTMTVAQGTLHIIDDFSSKYIESRPLRIWLPNEYDKNTEHAVIFMHDGQMLFDANSTWNKQEWGVDEVAQSLIDSGQVRPFIVVAIDNIAEKRHAEYFPQKPFEKLSQQQQNHAYTLERSPNQLLFGGHNVQSDNYAKFIVDELKPYIKQNYAVSQNHKDHFIMGSSMGGLISWYIVNEYPNEFGGAACLSAHWLGAFDPEKASMFKQFYHYLDQNLPMPQSFLLYFDHGDQTLDQYYPPYQAKINKLLKTKNYHMPFTKVMTFPGTDHSENAWNERLHIPFTFLLGEAKD